MRRIGVLLGLCLLTSCGSDEDGSKPGSETGGSAGARASQGGSSGGSAGGRACGGAGGESENTTSNSGAGGQPQSCAAGFSPADPCASGESCLYGDDCGTTTYSCLQGTWEATDFSGCGSNAVACEDGPDEYDPCENLGEVCDPDRDCLDVLECDAFYWRPFEVCTAAACEAAQPVVVGEPCDLPASQFCDGAPPCEYAYRCLMGVWTPFSSALPDGCN